MKDLGDTYVRSEFALHKSATDKTLSNFMEQWKEYADQIERERDRRELDMKLGGDGSGRNWGRDIEDELSEEQKAQLEKLKEETIKVRQGVDGSDDADGTSDRTSSSGGAAGVTIESYKPSSSSSS